MASAREVAEALGCTRQNVNKLAKKGTLTREPDGSFDLEKVKGQYAANVQYHQQKRSRQQKPPAEPPAELAPREDSMHEAELTQAWLRVHKMQREEMERSEKLVPADDVERIWGEITVQIRNRMMTLPGKLAPRLAMLNDARECQALLDREFREALSAMAQELSNAAA